MTHSEETIAFIGSIRRRCRTTGLRALARSIPSLLLAAVLLSSAAHALSPAERLDDPALETRARELSAELRCLVCQNQSIDDSDAPLAKDLRRLVRERLVSGDSNGQVKDFLVARYGDFVLLKPPFGWHTLLLWLTMPLLLLATLAYVFNASRNRPARPATRQEGLSAEEEARLSEIMRDRAEGTATRDAASSKS